MPQNIAAQADRARRSVRFAALRPCLTIFRSTFVKSAHGESAAAVTPTPGEARDAYRQALRAGDDLALLALARLGNQRGYPVVAHW
jgi:hypothetical protein